MIKGPGNPAMKNPVDLRELQIMNSINILISKSTNDTHKHALGMWMQMIEQPNFKLKPDLYGFIFDHLLPSVLKEGVRKEALKALKLTLPLLQNKEYGEHPKYKEFLDKCLKDYMPQVKTGIDTIPEWAQIWCFYLSVVRKDMARSVQINAFLSVAEAGFRSSNIDMRTKSFVCWRKLIEIYASEGQLQHKKRVKLISVPLQTTASKNLDLATAKFDCWWFLINNILPEASDEHYNCLIQFLSFCFGPLLERPLDGLANNSTVVSPGKLYNELKLTVIVALIRILGPSLPLITTLKLTHQMDDLARKFDPQKIFPRCRREVIYCCAEATALVYSVQRLTSDQQLQLTKNIWDNLLALIQHDEKLIKDMLLVIDAVKAIASLGSDPSRKGLHSCIPTIFASIKAAKFSPKGAQLVTEFSLHILTGLSATTKVMDKVAIEKAFDDLIIANYQTIHLLDNKVNFVGAMVKEVMKDSKRSSFIMWSLVWKKLLAPLEKTQATRAEFVKYGLENHFNQMIEDKDTWISNWNLQPNNQYLNQVSQIFLEAAKEEAASYNIVEVVVRMISSIGMKYDKSTAPCDVLKMFNSQVERFISTEFASTFVDSICGFLKPLTADEFTVILEDINGTLKVLKKCSKSTTNSEALSNLRGVLREKCALIESSTSESSKAFILLYKDWIYGKATNTTTTTTPSSGKKMGPPKKKPEEDFVPIKRDWSFNPKDLTDHQIERMKERRDDIPALYNDNSQSQDTRSLQPWALKTTPAAAVSEAKDSKPQTSVFAAVTATKAPASESTKTPLKNGASTAIGKPSEPVDSSPVLDTSRSDTPTRGKKSRAQSELSRLAIDTVEGHSVFDGDKKTRQSRRSSLDTTRNSPRKSSSGDIPPFGKRSEKVTTPSDKPKARRMSMFGEVKKERTLKPVEEANSPARSVAPKVEERAASKAEERAQKLDEKEKNTPKVEAGEEKKAKASQSSKDAKEKCTPKVEAGEEKMAKESQSSKEVKEPIAELKEPLKKNPTPPVESVPVKPYAVVDVASLVTVVKTADLMKPIEKERNSTPMVSIPNETVEPLQKKPKSTLPVVVAAPEKLVAVPELPQPVAKPEKMQVVPEEATEEPMDVGSESFVEEMNLAVSGNTSAALQRSIVSTPDDLDNVDERESTFLNDTINISPILKEVSQPKEAAASASLPVALPKVESKVADVMTTPKRSTEVPGAKENNPTAISTTPHSFLSKMGGRGAQMLQQTKLFQESTPKEKSREETVLSKEDTLAKMLIRTTVVPNNNRCSSPSTSILRRKRLEEDMDDTVESPAAKKKKVSFSDPPVSATKEFVRDSDRNKVTTISRMLMHKSRSEHSLRINGGGAGVTGSDSDDEDMNLINGGGERRAPPLDDGKIFEYLHKKYAEVYDEDEEAPPKVPLSQIRSLTKVLLSLIANNAPAKEEFFQQLMLAMPKDSLQWAVKENSSYAALTEVKQQATAGTFINYVVNLLKTDSDFSQSMSKKMGSQMDTSTGMNFIHSMLGDLKNKP